jgi:predicted  nucleic acid-binding Zn-ribbon protein
MVSTASLRYLPRTPQDTANTRRTAAMRAELADLSTRFHKLEREQHVQFDRIAQIQAELDEIKRLLKKMQR